MKSWTIEIEDNNKRKKLISIGLKRAYSEGRRQPLQYWLGKKRPEMAIWVSKSHLGKSNFKIIGDKNWNWKGGISKDKYYNNVIYRRKYLKKKGKSFIQFCNNNRKKRIIQAGILTLKTIQEIYEDNIKQYNTLTCYLCLQPIEFGKDCLEHKTPLSRGGTNAKDNLAIAHKGCNSKKSNRTVEEYKEIKK